jgi:hypothetical protein
MTFLKKLSIIMTLGLGMLFVAQAYDVDALARETTSILNFAQTIRQQNSVKAQNVAQWLEKKVIDTSYQVSDHDIIAIARIAANDTLKTEAKLAILAEQMNQETRSNRYRTFRNATDTIIATTVLTGLSALMIWAFIESVKNPAPIIYTQPRPGISVTWTNRYPNVSYNYW